MLETLQLMENHDNNIQNVVGVGTEFQLSRTTSGKNKINFRFRDASKSCVCEVRVNGCILNRSLVHHMYNTNGKVSRTPCTKLSSTTCRQQILIDVVIKLTSIIFLSPLQ